MQTRHRFILASLFLLVSLRLLASGGDTTGTLNSSLGGVSVVNTTSTTTIYTYKVAPNVLQSSGRLRVQLRGHVSTSAPQPGLVSIAVNYGVTVFTINITPVKGAVNAPMFLDLDITGDSVTTHGQVFHGLYVDGTSPNPATVQAAYGVATGNSNISQDLTVTWKWATASPSNAFVSDSCFTELMR